MATTVLMPAPEKLGEALAAFGRWAGERGWLPATAGNFSARIDAERAAMTRSGVDKGALGPADVVVVEIAADAPPGTSAETPLHLARYRADAAVGAVLHVHTVAATVLSRRHVRDGWLRVSGYEMAKTLAGFTTHATEVAIPVFPNDQDTVALAGRVERRLADEAIRVPGFLLAGHGLYAWGASVQDARRHVEGLEFLLACALEEGRSR